jgi:phenylalanyl-tRNA synthetase beta chain
MKFSYNWIREYLPGLDLSAAQVADLLTNHSYETVVVSEFKVDPTIRIVRITQIEPHPNADRLRLATVTDGTQEIRVVCGAPNIEVGQVVPHAPPGAQVLDKNGEYFELTEAVIRGQKSPGMLNSRRELGLGSDHDGIFVLPADTPLGSPLAQHLPADVILESDITPNRAHDSLSHLGIAREIAALTGLAIAEPAMAALPDASAEVAGFSLDVKSVEHTPRYIGVVLRDVAPGPAPLWLQARLYALGLKPINAAVDITNYVTLEIGNPSHAFDAAKLSDKKMGTRLAKAGETVRLLDGSEVGLLPQDVVVISGDVPVALAGIMGGVGSEVTPATNTIFLEVASFAPYAIQETSRRLGLRTEASQRFAKGMSPAVAEHAAGRLAYLFTSITGAAVVGKLEYYPQPAAALPISFRPARVAQLTGIEVAPQKARQILESLRCQVQEEGKAWKVTPPLDRLDLEIEEDIVEEVIRVYGLDNVPTATAMLESEGQVLPQDVRVREKIRDVLMQLGFTETYNYSFQDDRIVHALGNNHQPPIELVNPVAPEQHALRTTLIPGLVQNAQRNRTQLQRKFSATERALFEIGHTYVVGEGKQVATVIEEDRVAGIIMGTKDDVQKILDTIAEQLRFVQIPDFAQYIHSLPSNILKFQEPVTAFEIPLAIFLSSANIAPTDPKTLEELQTETAAAPQFAELNRYPSVFRDLSVLVAPDVATERVQEIIERTGGELVVDVDLFDVYEPDEDPQDRERKKSLAFHIEYQSSAKTLTDEEVAKIHNAIVAELTEELGVEIR